MEPLMIKGMKIGEGSPKTIISLMDSTLDGVLETIERGKEAQVDCYEWRVDFSQNVHESENAAREAKAIAERLPDNPLLFTFRSTSQGGQLSISVKEYVALNKAVIEAECIDMVDVETWIGDEAVSELIKCAHAHGVKAVVSYHNFKGTPTKEWMVALLTHMKDLGADIPKIAVMANSAADALALLGATDEVHRIHTDTPLLTMAMGREGSITRLTGELFGSAITFCALDKASAPGQISVSQARDLMSGLHQVICE